MNKWLVWCRFLLLVVLWTGGAALVRGAEAAGQAAVAPLSEADFAAGRQRLEALAASGKSRQAMLERPHFFIRTQTKYSGRLYMSNYYQWHLRPLFASRRLWDEGASDHKVTSFRKSLDLYESYGVDGVATFAWPGAGEHARTIGPLYEAAAQSGRNPDRFHVLLEISSEASYAAIGEEMFAMIVNNPYSFRVGGKSVISSYVMDNMPADQLAEHVRNYRQRSGDKTLFVPQVHFQRLYDEKGSRISVNAMYELYRRHGTLPASLLERMAAYLREYARAGDGLYLGAGGAHPDGKIDETFSERVLYPLFQGVLAEPEFNGQKILAAYCRVGYTSYHGSQHYSRDGTKTLRKNLELVRKFRPDLVICPEWDELNEDTGFQPQVTNPMATQRVMRSFMAALKGEEPSPNPGDDQSLPNLLISQRRQLIPGWTLDIELLQVPDTATGEEYAVVLEVLDEQRRLLFRSPPETFNTAVLKDKTFYLPSEDFKTSRALCSRLILDYRGRQQVIEEGLPFTVLRATTCWDQTYANTPLRNLLRPEQANVRWSRPDAPELAPGVSQVQVEVDLQSTEKFSAVEVVQDSLEQLAWDPHNEYLQHDSGRRLYKLSWHYVNNPHRLPLEFSVALDGAPSALTFDSPRPDRLATAGPPFSQSWSEGLDRWQGDRYVGVADHYPHFRLISIGTADVGTAVLRLNGQRRQGEKEPFAWEMPLAELGAYGVVSKVFADGLMIAVETQHRPCRNPLPVDSGQVQFSSLVTVDLPWAVLAVRAVTDTGKVFWSRPFAVVQATAAVSLPTVPVYVYSDRSGGGVRLDMEAARVPDIRYDFSPRRGNILTTPAGREFYAHAGGFLSTAIGFVGQEASHYAVPFRLYSGGLFKGADRPAPEWVACEDGGWALRFDGERGNFLTLPSTFMPQRAGYTLTFTLKPEEVKPEQVLFHHGGTTYGGLNISVVNGLFVLTFTRRTPHDPEQPTWSQKTFKTGIPLQAGVWQRVTVTYDLSTLSLDVDGNRESFPCTGIGLYFQQSHFGGRGDRLKDGSVPFFKGLLRDIGIRHAVADPAPARP